MCQLEQLPRRLLGVFFRLFAAGAILMHGIFRPLPDAVLDLLGLACLLDFGGGSGGGRGSGAAEITATEAGGTGE